MQLSLGGIGGIRHARADTDNPIRDTTALGSHCPQDRTPHAYPSSGWYIDHVKPVTLPDRVGTGAFEQHVRIPDLNKHRPFCGMSDSRDERAREQKRSGCIALTNHFYTGDMRYKNSRWIRQIYLIDQFVNVMNYVTRHEPKCLPRCLTPVGFGHEIPNDRCRRRSQASSPVQDLLYDLHGQCLATNPLAFLLQHLDVLEHGKRDWSGAR